MSRHTDTKTDSPRVPLKARRGLYDWKHRTTAVAQPPARTWPRYESANTDVERYHEWFDLYECAEACKGRGALQWALGFFRESFDLLSGPPALDLRAALVAANIGNVHLRLGEVKEAQAWLMFALRCASGEAQAWIMLTVWGRTNPAYRDIRAHCRSLFAQTLSVSKVQAAIASVLAPAAPSSGHTQATPPPSSSSSSPLPPSDLLLSRLMAAID